MSAAQQDGRGAAAPATATSPRAAVPSRRIDSQELLGDARQIEILHRGQSYCLRITSLGKLILTK
jgi:hemin uptake protein HemP